MGREESFPKRVEDFSKEEQKEEIPQETVEDSNRMEDLGEITRIIEDFREVAADLTPTTEEVSAVPEEIIVEVEVEETTETLHQTTKIPTKSWTEWRKSSTNCSNK